MKTMKTMITFFCLAMLIAASPVKPGYEIGNTATDFKLKNIDGKMISMADYKDAKGFILIFDCNTCPYSKAYNDRILSLSSKYTPLGFPLLAINSNATGDNDGETFEEMVDHAKRKEYNFPYLVDDTQKVAKAYGATNTPHVFILTRINKALKVAYIGTIDNNARNAETADKKYVEEALNALLAGKPVLTTKTKAVGCGIKWKDA